MENKIKLYMGFPSTGDRSDVQNYAIRSMQEKYADKIEFVYPSVFVGRIFHDYARNGIVEEFLASGCDILWMLDSDVSPPTTVLDLITEHGDKWEVAGAPYPVFMTPVGMDSPQVLFTVYRKAERGFHASRVPTKGLDFVDGIATGCIFVKRHVFEKLAKPYFEFKYEPESRQMCEGEDLGFCRKINELGYQFFIDYSQVCKHYKKVDLLDVNNYAINFSNIAVEEYDKSLREQIARSRLGLPKKSSLILP